MSTDTGATYGALMAVAARHAAWASMSLTTEPLGNRASVASAYAARTELLVAAGRHLLFLAGGPNRLTGRAATLEPEPSDRPALQLARALLDLDAKQTPDKSPSRGVPAQSWRSSGRALGAARDLVATHRDAIGADRTPDADVLEHGGERAAAYLLVAELVDTVSMADRDLALRAAQAGMKWKAAERALPDLAAVDDAVRALRQQAALGAAGSSRLTALTVARPAITGATPSSVLMQRAARLRQGAWTLARHPRSANAADLVEYAAAGVILHTHLAAHAAAMHDPGLTRSWQELRTGWAEQHRHLARFTSGTPATAGLRAEVAALPRAAAVALPVTRDASGVRAFGAPQLTGSEMSRLADVCRQIAETNESTLEALLARDALYIDARYLPGDRITDDIGLVEAKVQGRFVPAFRSDGIEALDAYQLLAGPDRAPAPAAQAPMRPARVPEASLLRA